MRLELGHMECGMDAAGKWQLEFVSPLSNLSKHMEKSKVTLSKFWVQSSSHRSLSIWCNFEYK